jgi:hypothetical protein
MSVALTISGSRKAIILGILAPSYPWINYEGVIKID